METFNHTETQGFFYDQMWSEQFYICLLLSLWVNLTEDCINVDKITHNSKQCRIKSHTRDIMWTESGLRPIKWTRKRTQSSFKWTDSVNTNRTRTLFLLVHLLVHWKKTEFCLFKRVYIYIWEWCRINQQYLMQKIKIFLVCIKQDTAGKYRELAAKKCHHVPKPIVELQRHCMLAECPVRTTPAIHRWSTYHHTYPPQPVPHPPSPAEWHSSPWSQVCSVREGSHLAESCEEHCIWWLMEGRLCLWCP